MPPGLPWPGGQAYPAGFGHPFHLLPGHLHVVWHATMLANIFNPQRQELRDFESAPHARHEQRLIMRSIACRVID